MASFEDTFLRLASGFIAFSNVSSDKIKDKKFMSFFGVPSRITGKIWSLLELHLPEQLQETKVRRIHLLWCLLFLQHYGSETITANTVKRTKKTTRKWIWMVISLLRDLPMVSIFCFHFFFVKKQLEQNVPIYLYGFFPLLNIFFF